MIPPYSGGLVWPFSRGVERCLVVRGVLEPDAQREFDLRPERSPRSLLGYTPWPSSQEILRTGPDVQAVAAWACLL